MTADAPNKVRPRTRWVPHPDDSDPLLPPAEAAAEFGISLPAFWAAVRCGRAPLPHYPLPRSPRWRRSELRAALEATRMLPRDAMAKRRAARIEKAST